MQINERYEKIERFLGRMFISVIVFIVVFLIVDKISLLFISPLSRYDQEQGSTIIPKPYVMHGGRPNFKKGEVAHNALGYRGAEPVMPKPKNEYRIFILGGSTVYAGNPSIAEFLEELFHKAGLKNVKVYNYGLLSLVSGESLARIVFEVSELSPNYIIMYNGANDILHPLKADPRPGYPHDFFVLENNPLLIKGLEGYPRYSLFAFGFNLPRHFLRPVFIDRLSYRRKMRAEVRYLQNTWRADIAENYVKNVIKASIISNAFGSEFTAFLQPTIYFKEPLSDEEQVIIRNLSVGKMHALIIRNSILEGVKLHDYQDKFVDATNIFDGHGKTIFKDDIHIKDEKKKMVAYLMFNYILRKIR